MTQPIFLSLSHGIATMLLTMLLLIYDMSILLHNTTAYVATGSL